MRDPLSWLQVRHKLPLTFAFLCIVAFGLGGYVVSTAARDALGEQIRLRLNDRASSLNLVVDKSLELLGRRVEDFASDGFIRLELERLMDARRDGDRARIGSIEAGLRRHLLVNKLPLAGEFVDALVHDQGGAPILRARTEELPPETLPDAEELSIGPLRGPGPIYSYPTFALFTPVRHLHDPSKIGYLQIVVRADTWARGLQRNLEFPGATGFTARLVSLRGFSLSLVPREPGAPPDESAEDRIRFTSTIARTGWTLELAVDGGVLTVPIKELVSKFIYVGLALVMLTVFLVLFPRQFLLKPLSAMQDAVKRFGEGDFSARVPSESRDEVGDLAAGFNFMAKAIEDRTRTLERTARMLERREADIRFERDRLNTVIRSMEDGLFILDAGGKVSLSNMAARPVLEALGGSSDGRIQRKCGGAGKESESCLHCIADFRNDMQGCLVTIDSKIYEINGAILPGPDGSVAGKVFVSRDATVRIRQAEQEAHQERMAVLGEIAAVMAHELNNPLAAISMFSQMLMKGLDTGTQLRSHADVIHRNTESCKKTIRRLLDMATVAISEPDIFEVDQLVEDVRQLLEPVAQRAGVQVRIVGRAGDGRAFGDELQLRQATVNLVMNGIQAAQGVAGGTVDVETVDRGADDVAIVVTDSGAGIPPESADHIFEPFYTTKAPGEGTGLGLPTSRRIVDAQGGRLALVETRPGRTVFEIRVPRRRSRQAGTGGDAAGVARVAGGGPGGAA